MTQSGERPQIISSFPGAGTTGVLIGLFAIGFFSGCGPIYDTQYIFDPPSSSSGLACTYQCENSKGQCEQLEEYRNEDCERRAERERERCEDDIWRRKGREPKWYECGGSSCSTDTERCERNYRSCYQSCGGRVRAETTCIANCPPTPPPQQAQQPASNAPYYREDYRDKDPKQAKKGKTKKQTDDRDDDSDDDN